MKKKQHLRCINCLIAIRFNSRRLDGTGDCERIREIVAQQIAPLTLNDTDVVCKECWVALSDHVAMQLERPNPTQRVKLMIKGHRYVCVNCGISLLRTQYYRLLRHSELHSRICDVMVEWMAPRTLNATDSVCVKCFVRARRVVLKKMPDTSLASVKPPNMDRAELEAEPEILVKQEPDVFVKQEPVDPIPDTINYTTDLEMKQEYSDDTPQSRTRKTAPTIKEYMNDANNTELPLELDVTNENHIGNDCESHNKTPDASDEEWFPNKRRKSTPPQTDKQPNITERTTEPKICLPNFRRAPFNKLKCVYKGCVNKKRTLAPLHLKRHVFYEYGYYLGPRSYVCDDHLDPATWEGLDTDGSLNTFTVKNIEDILSICKQNVSIDFEAYELMDDKLFEYLLGKTKKTFKEILDKEPAIDKVHKGRIGLAACLMKAYTGDSENQIGNLLGLPRSTLVHVMARVTRVMKDKSALISNKRKVIVYKKSSGECNLDVSENEDGDNLQSSNCSLSEDQQEEEDGHLSSEENEAHEEMSPQT